MIEYQRQIADRIAEIVDPGDIDFASLFSSPPDPDLGDLAFPCFQLARSLKKAPPAIAEEIANASWDFPWLAQVAAAGPYVNFLYDPAEFSRRVISRVVSAGENFGTTDNGQGKTVIVEYSSPNIAKHLAVHHLRSTMLGQVMANMFRASGYNVISMNHLGDWGTGFGKLLAAWELHGDEEGLEENPLESREDPVAVLNNLYVRFNQETATNPQLEETARDWFRRLENGDPLARERWQRIRDASWSRFERIYSRLGVSFDEVIGESFYEDKMPAVIEELTEKGLLEESDGAEVVRLEEEIPPMLIRKRDGSTLYGTRDLASAEYRWQRWEFHRALYVVDAGQSLHFRQVFGVLQRLGRDFFDRLEHTEFGVMRMNVDGQWVKGKTREGQVVLLEDVLDDAIQMAREVVLEKNPDLETSIESIAESVGIGAVVFSDMKAKRGRDVNFDLEKFLSFEGETGPYLQYTHVRFCGILRKSGVEEADYGDGSLLVEPEEKALLVRLNRFDSVIARAAEEAEPSLLSQYLLDLAGEFNTYYAKHRVISDNTELTRHRLTLISALRVVLSRGLRLLCLEPLERM